MVRSSSYSAVRHHALLRAVDRLQETIAIDGLENVIRCVHVKCPYGVRVGGRHKNDRWHAVGSNRPHDSEPVDLGHLNVQQHEVWFVLLDTRDGVCSVATLANHLEICLVSEQRSQLGARQRLVVHDQHAQLARVWRFRCRRPVHTRRRRRPLIGHSRYGTSISTANPPAGAVET